MGKKSSEFGRTFFDFISEHPKKTFFTFLLIIVILSGFLLKGSSLKVGGMEINTNDIETKKQNDVSNINSGTNNGIVGNNNTVNNISEKPIKLSDDDKKSILVLINRALNNLPDKTTKDIEIIAMLGSTRSLKLADLIKEFVEKEGYIVTSFTQNIFAKTIEGTIIYSNGRNIQINIGVV